MPTFQPSRYSQTYGYALPNTTGKALVSLIPVYGNIASAIDNANLTKDQRYNEAVRMANKYDVAYHKEKARLKAKGKEAFPADPSRGAFANNGHRDYRLWKKWEKIAAERAEVLKEKLEQKGKLAPATERDLNTIAALPELTAKEERRRDRRERAAKHKKKGMSDADAEALAESELPEDYSGGDVENESETGYLVPVLIGGAVLALGGGGLWFATRKRD